MKESRLVKKAGIFLYKRFVQYLRYNSNKWHIFRKWQIMEFRTQITKGGRLVVPAKLRKALQIEVGDEVVLRLEKGSLRLIPLHQAISLAQEAVRKYVPEGVSLVDELIQARRAEARRE